MFIGWNSTFVLSLFIFPRSINTIPYRIWCKVYTLHAKRRKSFFPNCATKLRSGRLLLLQKGFANQFESTHFYRFQKLGGNCGLVDPNTCPGFKTNNCSQLDCCLFFTAFVAFKVTSHQAQIVLRPCCSSLNGTCQIQTKGCLVTSYTCLKRLWL